MCRKIKSLILSLVFLLVGSSALAYEPPTNFEEWLRLDSEGKITTTPALLAVPEEKQQQLLHDFYCETAKMSGYHHIATASASRSLVQQAVLVEQALQNFLVCGDLVTVKALDASLLDIYDRHGDEDWQNYYHARRMLLPGIEADGSIEDAHQLLTDIADNSDNSILVEKAKQLADVFNPIKHQRDLSLNLLRFFLQLSFMELVEPSNPFRSDLGRDYELRRRIGVITLLIKYIEDGTANTIEEAISHVQNRPMESDHFNKSGRFRGPIPDQFTLHNRTIVLPSRLHDYSKTIHITPSGGTVIFAADGERTINKNVLGRTRGAIVRYNHEIPSRTHDFSGEKIGTITIKNGKIIDKNLREHDEAYDSLYLALEDSEIKEAWVAFVTHGGKYIPDRHLFKKFIEMEKIKSDDTDAQASSMLWLASHYRQLNMYQIAELLLRDQTKGPKVHEANAVLANMLDFPSDRFKDRVGEILLVDAPLVLLAAFTAELGIGALLARGALMRGGTTLARILSTSSRFLTNPGWSALILRKSMVALPFTLMMRGLRFANNRPITMSFWKEYLYTSATLILLSGIHVLHTNAIAYTAERIPMLRCATGLPGQQGMTLSGAGTIFPKLSSTGQSLSRNTLLLEYSSALTAMNVVGIHTENLLAQESSEEYALPNTTGEWLELFAENFVFVLAFHAGTTFAGHFIPLEVSPGSVELRWTQTTTRHKGLNDTNVRPAIREAETPTIGTDNYTKAIRLRLDLDRILELNERTDQILDSNQQTVTVGNNVRFVTGRAVNSDAIDESFVSFTGEGRVIGLVEGTDPLSHMLSQRSIVVEVDPSRLRPTGKTTAAEMRAVTIHKYLTIPLMRPFRVAHDSSPHMALLNH